MKYDFETIIDRHHWDSIAVDGIGHHEGHDNIPDAPKEGFSVIPMWIADMNFPCFPGIQEELIKRINHPLFGYFIPSDEYYDSIIYWQKERHHVDGLTKECIGYENGVLGGLISSVKSILPNGGNVLVNSPTYVGFTHSLTDAGYNIITSPLIHNSCNGKWMMDYADMDQKIKENNIKIGIVCNPHNPCGRNWSKEELSKCMEVYQNNNCIVISDEIWADVILNNEPHIPTQMVSNDAKNRTIALYAPSKTFNVAGIVGSYHIIYNQELRDKVIRESKATSYNNMNVLSMHALTGAYNQEGLAWTNELCEVLANNAQYAFDFINQNFKGVSLGMPEATYMIFICCEDYIKAHHVTLDEIIKRGWDVGVAWQDGRPFHGEYAIRINLASPFSMIKEAFDRMKKYVFID